MNEISSESIIQLLPDPCGRIFIGYSGGIDSQVLLHWCASLSTLKPKLIAVYVHHGLQIEADDWGEHCRKECLKLGIEFTLIFVDANAKRGESPEAAARNARYSAFERLIEPNDALLLAQHREDQLETVLLQLFRGGGIHGLAGMPARMRFGSGWLLRPFLNVSKQAIQAHALRHGLQWIEDPSNLKSDFDRNFLRNEITPLLKLRWPGLDKTVARAAAHCGSASQLLDDWSETTLDKIYDPADKSLSIRDWQAFNEPQRAWLLRQWLKQLGLKAPSQAILNAIVVDMIQAKDGANPEVRLQGHYIKKYRHRLYCLGEHYFRKDVDDLLWKDSDASLEMRNGYRLTRIASTEGVDRRLWDSRTVTVQKRRGGEVVKLAGRAGHHSLKKLYQEAGVPPWEREVRPLIYLNEQLAAVAGLWVAEWASGEGDCFRVIWQP